MKDLQAIIDKRAEEKLRKEIQDIHYFLYNKYDLLNGVTINTGTVEKPYVMGIHRLLDATPLSQKVFDLNIEKYKEKEAEKFIKEVEQLKEKVEALGEEINYLQ